MPAGSDNRFHPVPLPGTHLAEVDCIDCGAIVLAVPEYADRARCAACGRALHGADVGGAAPARTEPRNGNSETARVRNRPTLNP